MKKLVLMAAAIVAVSFASCGGNKAANAEQAAADSIRIADSIAAAQAAEATVEADTTAQDTTAVVAE